MKNKTFSFSFLCSVILLLFVTTAVDAQSQPEKSRTQYIFKTSWVKPNKEVVARYWLLVPFLGGVRQVTRELIKTKQKTYEIFPFIPPVDWQEYLTSNIADDINSYTPDILDGILSHEDSVEYKLRFDRAAKIKFPDQPSVVNTTVINSNKVEFGVYKFLGESCVCRDRIDRPSSSYKSHGFVFPDKIEFVALLPDEDRVFREAMSSWLNSIVIREFLPVSPVINK